MSITHNNMNSFVNRDDLSGISRFDEFSHIDGLENDNFSYQKHPNNLMNGLVTIDMSHPDEDEEREIIMNKIVKSSRLRKKYASRSIESDFKAIKKKRRIYFCCISSEIDMNMLQHLFTFEHYGMSTLNFQDVLYLSDSYITNQNDILTMENIWNSQKKEIFIFNFGIIVFWGCSKLEESAIIKMIRQCIVKGELSVEEFEDCDDDMAYIMNPNDLHNGEINIENDIIYLSPSSSLKQRLSISFAIAQSSILALFEGRIERKITEYKYMPELLSEKGKLKLTTKGLANMIGEIFVIRHDVNLNSEILETPDFFWHETEEVVDIYKMTATYLEIKSRIHVVNTRLNMLFDLLEVLQRQYENVHAIGLEWIVIGLIVISVILEVCVISNQLNVT